MKNKRKVNVGDKFGKLTVLEWIKADSKIGRRGYWVCVCDCGNFHNTPTSALLKGRCIRCRECKGKNTSERFSKQFSRKTHPKLYDIWAGIINRARNDKRDSYINISVEPSWDVRQGGSFENFLKDMGDTYFKDASIDRVENSVGYLKDNCRWVKLKEQAANRDPYNVCGVKGATFENGVYYISIQVNGIYYNLGGSKDKEEAKLVYNLVAESHREVTYLHKDIPEDVKIVSKNWNKNFHELTNFKFFDGEYRDLINTAANPLIGEKKDGSGLGYYFPSRSSVRDFGFDLRAVCRCLKNPKYSHLGFKFENLNS